MWHWLDVPYTSVFPWQLSKQIKLKIEADQHILKCRTKYAWYELKWLISKKKKKVVYFKWMRSMFEWFWTTHHNSFYFVKLHRSQIPLATRSTPRKMQQKESLHSPQRIMTCLRCALRANHQWVSVFSIIQTTQQSMMFLKVKMSDIFSGSVLVQYFPTGGVTQVRCGKLSNLTFLVLLSEQHMYDSMHQWYTLQ